jgi:hypothetical protein
MAEVTTALPILMRRARSGDIPFITNSWLKSFRDAPYVTSCPNNVYFGSQHRLIEQLIPRSVVLVACNEDDPDQILGWIAAEVLALNAEDESQGKGLVIHYCYVKRTFRQVGLARRLWATLVTTEEPVVTMYTHRTMACKRLGLTQRGIVYNPYAAVLRVETNCEAA